MTGEEWRVLVLKALSEDDDRVEEHKPPIPLPKDRTKPRLRRSSVVRILLADGQVIDITVWH